MRLLQRRPATGEEEPSFLVSSERYGRQRWVGADELRPRWVLAGSLWRAEVGAEPAQNGDAGTPGA